MTGIFYDNAPKYWAKGIPVIPLRPLTKIPQPDAWQEFASRMIPEEVQRDWLIYYADGNIGLPCGPQSGVVVIDYDYNDPRVEEAILKILPKSPWIRVGRKGWARAFRYNNQPAKKIHDTHGATVVEVISVGNQIVLPPSIHPDTMMPYTANCDLAEVVNSLPVLPEDIEDRLRAAISQIISIKDRGSVGGKFKFSEKIAKGSRDIKMNQLAGLSAMQVIRGEIPLMRAIDIMQAWHDNNIPADQKDAIDINKGKGQIVQYLINDVLTKGKILPPGWDEGLTDQEKLEWGLNFGEEHEEWTYEQVMTYIQQAMENNPSNSPEIVKMETFIVQKLSKSQNLNPIEVDKILNLLKVAGKANVAAYKKMIKQLQSGPIDGTSHFQIAEETVRYLNERLGKTAFWNDQIWYWEGSRWETISDQYCRSVIQKEFGHLDTAKRFADHKGILSVVKDILPQTIKPPVEIQGVNFANCFLNRELEPLEHNPEFGMTYTLPFNYEPDLSGKCPLFIQFLSDCWGEDDDYEDKVTALREAIAVTLFGAATKFQKCFLLQGRANSGKSVLLDIISAIVPAEARSAIAPTMWQDKFASAMLVGKLLNIAGELHESRPIDGKTFKEFIDGSEVTGQFKHGQLFRMAPKAAHWFASNPLPRSKDISAGFSRRWLILPFSKQVSADKMDRDLANKIIYEEIEAIVAWSVESWHGLQKRQSIVEPISHKRIIREVIMQNSTVHYWMDQRLLVKENGRLEPGKLFMDYFMFCAKAGLKPVNAKEFSIQLDSIMVEEGYSKSEPDANGVPVYTGFVLKGVM